MVPDQLRGEYIYQLRIIDLLGTGFQKNGIQLLRGRKMQDPWQALKAAQKMNSSKIIVYSLAQTVAVMSVRGQPEGDFGAICHNARPGTGANFEFRVSLMRLNQSGNYAGEQTLASLLLSILILIY